MHRCFTVVVGRYRRRLHSLLTQENGNRRRMILGRSAREGESPVNETVEAVWITNLSKTGHEESCLNLGGPPSKAKYEIATDSE